jgi:hypothetical protein
MRQRVRGRNDIVKLVQSTPNLLVRLLIRLHRLDAMVSKGHISAHRDKTP